MENKTIKKKGVVTQYAILRESLKSLNREPSKDEIFGITSDKWELKKILKYLVDNDSVYGGNRMALDGINECLADLKLNPTRSTAVTVKSMQPSLRSQKRQHATALQPRTKSHAGLCHSVGKGGKRKSMSLSSFEINNIRTELEKFPVPKTELECYANQEKCHNRWFKNKKWCSLLSDYHDVMNRTALDFHFIELDKKLLKYCLKHELEVVSCENLKSDVPSDDVKAFYDCLSPKSKLYQDIWNAFGSDESLDKKYYRPTNAHNYLEI